MKKYFFSLLFLCSLLGCTFFFFFFLVHQVFTRVGTLLWYTFFFFWSTMHTYGPLRINTSMLHLTYLKIFFTQEQQATRSTKYNTKRPWGLSLSHSPLSWSLVQLKAPQHLEMVILVINNQDWEQCLYISWQSGIHFDIKKKRLFNLFFLSNLCLKKDLLCLRGNKYN